MKKLLLVLIGVLFIAGSVMAQDALSPKAQKAKDLVKKGVAFYKANGLEKTIAAINDTKGQFVDGEYYLFIHRYSDGINIARGDGNMKRLGTSVIDSADPKGKLYVQEQFKIAKKDGSGWVSYGFVNPTTKALGTKNSYLEDIGIGVMGCGFFTE